MEMKGRGCVDVFHGKVILECSMGGGISKIGGCVLEVAYGGED